MDSTAAETKNKYVALMLTIGFHIVLFLIFIFVVFVTPIPPFEIKPVPEIELGLGMEGLGNTDAGGSGKKDKDIATSEEATPAKAIANNDAPDEVITDETATEVVVKKTPKKKEKRNNEEPKPKVVEEPKPSTELSRALANLRNIKEHSGKGEGDGNTGGSGTGSQHGVGDGDGTGHGNGTPGYNGKGGYDLKGRMLIQRPAHISDSQQEGIVVVEIIVNEDGKVVKATPGQRGSTTTSSNLYAKARQAALTVKFNPSPDGITEQRGTYTFVFRLE
jgi:periplasmic protein TonB